MGNPAKSREIQAALLLVAMAATIAFVGGLTAGRFIPRHEEEPCKAAMEANYRAFVDRGTAGFLGTWPAVERACLSDVMPQEE